MTTETKQAPIVVLRDGALKVSIWENEGEHGKFLTANFSRTYTIDGQPRDSHTFGRTDLLPIAELARRAHGQINLHAAFMKPAIEESPTEFE